MKYTVLWTKNAEAQLTKLWLDAANRKAVTQAAHEIDAVLASAAASVGESRPDGSRILFVPPLGVLFHLDAGDLKVFVVKVWQYKKRGSKP